MTIVLYGAAPYPESPRITPWAPDSVAGQSTQPIAAPFVPPVATPRGPAIDAVLMTDETLVAVEQHCMAMLRYLALDPDQKAAVDRYIEAARRLTGRTDITSETYKLAQQLAEGLRSHPTRQK